MLTELFLVARRLAKSFLFTATALGMLTLSPALHAEGTAPAYGANAAAGHFLTIADTRIYYETYGSGGTSLVLLHGGLYGYIEEFGALIQKMSETRRVIAIATRGHGKSDIGVQPFSFELFAGDAFAVIRRETTGMVDVLGFSDGALTSYLLASEHPECVRRLVAIGGPRGTRDWTEKALVQFNAFKASDVERDNPQFVADRKRLMHEPNRWDEFVTRLSKLEGVSSIITDQQIRSIEAPTLLIAGDRDPYNQTDKFLEIFHLLRHGQLMIVPGSGHVVLRDRADETITAVEEFLNSPHP